MQPTSVDKNSRNVIADLIYDIGLYSGDDTAYYLHRGFRVVAIDANPIAIDKARTRFGTEIEAGRLTLVNVGVSRTAGTATFWVSDKPDWSSFHREIASREGTGHKPVCVATLPFAEVLAKYGVPCYLKIDIEGNDYLCVEAVDQTSRPKYISVESECVGDTGTLTEEQALSMLNLLQAVGYTRFKLVNQRGFAPVRPNSLERFGMRLITSAAYYRLRLPGLSAIAERFTDQARIAKLGYPFTDDTCSGPFGEDIPGGWIASTSPG